MGQMILVLQLGKALSLPTYHLPSSSQITIPTHFIQGRILQLDLVSLNLRTMHPTWMTPLQTSCSFDALWSTKTSGKSTQESKWKRFSSWASQQQILPLIFILVLTV